MKRIIFLLSLTLSASAHNLEEAIKKSDLETCQQVLTNEYFPAKEIAGYYNLSLQIINQRKSVFEIVNLTMRPQNGWDECISIQTRLSLVIAFSSLISMTMLQDSKNQGLGVLSLLTCITSTIFFVLLRQEDFFKYRVHLKKLYDDSISISMLIHKQLIAA